MNGKLSTELERNFLLFGERKGTPFLATVTRGAVSFY